MSLQLQTHRCAICSKTVTKDDYCFGCRSFVCENCDKNEALAITHEAEAHEQEPPKEADPWKPIANYPAPKKQRRVQQRA